MSRAEHVKEQFFGWSGRFEPLQFQSNITTTQVWAWSNPQNSPVPSKFIKKVILKLIRRYAH